MKNKHIDNKSPLSKLVSDIYQRKDIDKLKSYMNTQEGENEFEMLSLAIWKETQGMKENPELRKKEAKRLIQKQRQSKNKKLIFIYASSIAASILIFLAIGYHFSEETKYKINPEIRKIADKLKKTSNDNEIQLVLTDDKRIALEGEAANVKYNTGGDVKVNDKIVHEETPVKEKEEKYNQLIVPTGKRSTLELSDGTILWVNSGTSVIYPVTFKKNIREIYVDGEIFLNVHSDKQSPFFVRTKNMDVRVTGTEFNVMAYESDKIATVVLVSGSVQVHADNKQSDLTPKNCLTYTEETRSINIHEVDVTDYISWKDGFYQFKSENMGEILKRLSRYYGITIQVEPEAAKLICYGKLDLKDNLSRVLNGLKQTAPILVEQRDNQFIVTLNHNAYE
ncbi:FecR family protein [Parabacteroides bouchesdurhonensis]|uniref:FecR family protein n=1 Tax=Parabacteroides bouchesdurhonensis TaxID=1936995 RepID=UPI000E4FDBEC|nr:FecR family protein [Parabacteroides bouchesdurhonensis]RHJ95291.1 FecR family protein [Bacteroides sp. AM07-16]